MANQYGPYLQFSAKAGADLSAAQYTFVKWSAGTIVQCTAATDKPVGVLQNDPANTRTATVLVFGVSKVSSGANLAQDDLIGTNSSGQAVALIPGTDTTKYVAGRVLYDTSAATGDLTACFINCMTLSRAA
jgi:hypothetical protein